MKITVIFGTEQGGSEMTADDIAASLKGSAEVSVKDMADIELNELDPSSLLLVVCATHGEGDLPYSAEPLVEKLNNAKPDLSGLKYGIFARGDTLYAETFTQGAVKFDAILAALGGQRIGEFARHDASDLNLTDEMATNWAHEIVKLYTSL
ncbi:MAG: hypothetical protein RL129_162 [Actinomycetota bacterium]